MEDYHYKYVSWKGWPTFEYFGYTYEILDEDKKEVALIAAPHAPERCVIPEKVSYNNNEYTVTAIDSHKRLKIFHDKRKKVCEVGGNSPFQINIEQTFVKEVVLPQTIKTIKHFGSPNKIETIIIPNGCITIGSFAFQGCSCLKRITIPDSVISIGDHAFSLCKSLEEVLLSNSITSIRERVFEGCISLKKIVIPSSVKTIGYNADGGGDVDRPCGLKVVDILNEEGKVVVHPEAFTDSVKINYLGKKEVLKPEPKPKAEKKQVEEDLPNESANSDSGWSREKWENWEKDVKPALKIMDEIVAAMPYIQDGSYQLNYASKQYIGFAQQGKGKNFATFYPQGKALVVNTWGMEDSDEIEKIGKALPNFEHKVTSRNVSYHTFKFPVDKAVTAEQVQAALDIIDMARKNYEK